MNPLLEIEDLHVAYGKAEVVHGVSLTVGEGEFVAMIGRNGAGKSTSLHAASGLIAKRAGRVRFAGRDVTNASPRDIVRAGLVQVLEGHRVFHPLTVEDNLLIGTYARTPHGERSKLDAMYALFPELAERRRQLASRLSGGQQQILAVAQGIIAEPRLLILDEPAGGLAPMVIDRILDVATNLARDGVAILLVEQLVEKALAHADRCYLMATGRIVHEGPAKELAGSDILHSAYLGGGTLDSAPPDKAPSGTLDTCLSPPPALNCSSSATNVQRRQPVRLSCQLVIGPYTTPIRDKSVATLDEIMKDPDGLAEGRTSPALFDEGYINRTD